MPKQTPTAREALVELTKLVAALDVHLCPNDYGGLEVSKHHSTDVIGAIVDAREALKAARTALTESQPAPGAKAEQDELAEWLKDGETVLERLKREHADVLSVMTMLAGERQRVEQLEKRLAALTESQPAPEAKAGTGGEAPPGFVFIKQTRLDEIARLAVDPSEPCYEGRGLYDDRQVRANWGMCTSRLEEIASELKSATEWRHDEDELKEALATQPAQAERQASVPEVGDVDAEKWRARLWELIDQYRLGNDWPISCRGRIKHHISVLPGRPLVDEGVKP